VITSKVQSLQRLWTTSCNLVICEMKFISYLRNFYSLKTQNILQRLEHVNKSDILSFYRKFYAFWCWVHGFYIEPLTEQVNFPIKVNRAQIYTNLRKKPTSPDSRSWLSLLQKLKMINKMQDELKKKGAKFLVNAQISA